MTKLKVKNRYATVPNGLLNDKRISFKSKGIYAYIQSKPDGWDFSIQRISYESKESIDAIRSGVHELEAVGYLERIKFQNEKGHWEIEYILHENPVMECSAGGDPTLENPTKENYINNINKEYNKKEIINKENNNIFLEKKINLDHIADIGKMVNNENYRFADANNTINKEGYRPKAEEKNYPPYSAAPPIKKEEKNENDFEAVLGGEKVEEVEYIANEEIGGKKRKKQGKKQIEKYINEFGQCVSLNDNGEEVRWFGVDDSQNVGLTMAEMENLKNKYGYDKSSFLSGIEMFSNWKLQNPEKADKKKSDYLPMAGGGWVYKELLKMKKINNNQEKIDKIDKYEKLINETLKKYEK